MISAKKAIGISFGGQYLELLINFLAVLILARILSPEEIGIYSVAAFLMAVLHTFRDFGVTQYIIQEKELNEQKIRSAMGVSIILAFTVSIILASLSGVISRLYQNQEIEKILLIMSGSFAISPFGSFLVGIYRREMQLTKLLVVRLASTISHVSVSVALALHGFGALSLAWANFVGILSFGIMANLLRPKGLPLFPNFKLFKSIFKFGSVAAVGNAINTIGTNGPDVIVGKIIDLAAVGYLSRANGLVQLFSRLLSDAILPLILPYFSHIRREGGDFKEAYVNAISLFTSLAWPFFAGTSLLAAPMVRTLYGSQWDASIPLVELLGLAGIIGSFTLFAGQVMTANGRIKDATYSQIWTQPLRILLVLYAAHHGLFHIGVAIIIAELFSLIIVSIFLKRTVQIGLIEAIIRCWKSLIVTLISCLVPLGINVYWEENISSTWLPLVLGICGAIIGWIVGVWITNHPIGKEMVSMIQHIVRMVRRIDTISVVEQK